MKKLLFLTFLCQQSLAQLYVGSGVSIRVQSGALLSVSGLTLQPSANLDITNTTFAVSHTALTGPAGTGIKRVHQVSGPVSFSGTLAIVYYEEELNGNSESNLKLARRSTPSSSFTISDNSVVNEAANHVTAAFTSAASLQGEITAFSSTALPVTWISFDARREGMQAVLSWATVREVNTSYFAIERSTDGKYFTEAGQVKAGGNASGNPSTYLFSEIHPAGGTFYYRIRSTDLDGSTDITGIRAVTITPAAELAAFPNPSQGRVSVTGLRGAGSVKVYDLSGRLVQTQAVRSHTTDINLSEQARGLYLIVAEQNGNAYLVGKVLKE